MNIMRVIEDTVIVVLVLCFYIVTPAAIVVWNEMHSDGHAVVNGHASKVYVFGHNKSVRYDDVEPKFSLQLGWTIRKSGDGKLMATNLFAYGRLPPLSVKRPATKDEKVLWNSYFGNTVI